MDLEHDFELDLGEAESGTFFYSGGKVVDRAATT